jgi:hypothetical protein
LGDFLKRKRTVLHFDPEKIESGAGHGAIYLGIGCVDCSTDNLFPVLEFLSNRVVHTAPHGLAAKIQSVLLAGHWHHFIPRAAAVSFTSLELVNAIKQCIVVVVPRTPSGLRRYELRGYGVMGTCNAS